MNACFANLVNSLKIKGKKRTWVSGTTIKKKLHTPDADGVASSIRTPGSYHVRYSWRVNKKITVIDCYIEYRII